MGQDPSQIRNDIETTRACMGDTAEALGHKADVPGRAREAVSDKVDTVKSKFSGGAPSGEDVIKRMILDPQTRRIRGFELYSTQPTNQRDRKLASTTIVSYHQDETTGAYLPRELKIEWPAADTKLTIRLSPRKTEINTITPDLAASLFRCGEYPKLEKVDLAQMAARRVSPGDPQRQIANRQTYDRDVRPAQAAELTGRIEFQPVPRRSGPRLLRPDPE